MKKTTNNLSEYSTATIAKHLVYRHRVVLLTTSNVMLLVFSIITVIEG